MLRIFNFYRGVILPILFFSLYLTDISAQRIPNTEFGIFPLFGRFTGNGGTISEQEAIEQIKQLKEQVGENEGLFKVGFGGIFTTEKTLARNCSLLKAHNLSHVTIVSVQNHHVHRKGISIALGDLRNFQWRMDGKTWEGVKHDQDARDYRIVTPSRYALALRKEFERRCKEDMAAPIARVIKNIPGVIYGVNACIENELALGYKHGMGRNHLADYSPYAITEFRDWMLHRGMYNADSGVYSGQGAQEAIIGAYKDINGRKRSQFFDDPTPDNANGTGVSFNEYFGTQYATWSLKFWDLREFPEPITDVNFDPSPDSGRGFITGGFDAPRVIEPQNIYWKAWSWDVQDHELEYPNGNPQNPAFGFRQVMVRNFVNSILKWLEEGGIPKELITAHQIPAEMLFSKHRSRGSASPIWTGLSEHNGTVGITRYGLISVENIKRITQYSNNWGIYEWHPNQRPKNNDELKAIVKSELDKVYNANCRAVCPFTWVQEEGGLSEGNSYAAIYPVKGCGFAEGLKEWLEEQMDK